MFFKSKVQIFQIKKKLEISEKTVPCILDFLVLIVASDSDFDIDSSEGCKEEAESVGSFSAFGSGIDNVVNNISSVSDDEVGSGCGIVRDSNSELVVTSGMLLDDDKLASGSGFGNDDVVTRKGIR